MAALGDFLSARRAALRPGDVGVEPDGRRRRVVGLRREELARAAGVSAAYYTRLEQGMSRNASEEVLDALARALRLSTDERAHLHSLARRRRQVEAPQGPEQVRQGARSVLDSLTGSPAMILDRRLDVLAWNPLGHRLLAWTLPYETAGDPVRSPNLARIVFLDREARELWQDWDEKASAMVAYLRLSSGRSPDDPRLTGLVSELSARSDDFGRMWRAHPVRDCASTVRRYRHPLVGPLTLQEEVMSLTDPGQILTVHVAEPGSPSAAALRLLTGPAGLTGARPRGGTVPACP